MSEWANGSSPSSASLDFNLLGHFRMMRDGRVAGVGDELK